MFNRCLLALVLAPSLATAAFADFVPDPASVQREGPAYRYPQAGWIIVHVEGDPYERGRQQGKLLAPEITDYVRAYATILSPTAPAEGWKLTRRMVDALFVRRFDPELLEEMKGIADGANSAGAKFDGRPLDLTDIVAINSWPEIDSLDDALRATPNGLEGKSFDKSSADKSPPKSSRCSAFAATGAATIDGKAMIGHITMFDLYPCNFYNIWLDIKPTKGHRLILQGAPGSVQSGMDWYQNDAGMVMVETTIGQTKFDARGMSVGSRSRRAMQYGDNIDSVVKLLSTDNNGLYTNEWLLADMKTNEIAMYELGTATNHLSRSSKREWFGGTEGFYWGCNNTKADNVRIESVASMKDRPTDVTFCATDRDQAWMNLYQQFKGKMDGDFGKIAYSKPPLVSRHSCDAKYTTHDLATQMKSWATFGDPYGQVWEPSAGEREKFPEVKAIVSNPWTILAPTALAKTEATSPIAADLRGLLNDATADSGDGDDDDKPDAAPAWHGTLLPASDADLWLASAFAQFHDFAARSNQMPKSDDGTLFQSLRDQEELGVKLFEFRYRALNSKPQSPRSAKFDPANDDSMRGAVGRGALMLAELRNRIGSDAFDSAMDAFGKEHAGKATKTESFTEAMQKASNDNLKDFFHCWLDTPDALATLSLDKVACEKSGKDYIVTGDISAQGGCTPASINVEVVFEGGATEQNFKFAPNRVAFEITSEKKPIRVIVNHDGLTPIANGLKWTCSSFKRDLDHTLIVYGTHDDAIANRCAAEALQQTLVDQWEHAKLPIKPDTDVSEADLRQYLILIGGPDSNELVGKYRNSFPVNFGPHSFVVGNETYANMNSAVIIAASNPADGRFSIVCIDGLSGGATYRAAKSAAEWTSAPLKILSAKAKPRELVPPTPELVYEFK